MNQVLIFQLGEENYGVDILKIREIAELVPLTPVPNAPNWVEGILNRHGRVATVLSLSSFFDFPSAGRNSSKKIAVIDDPSMDVGILLEDPLEVISEWETAAEISRNTEFVKNRYVAGILISKGRIVNLFDINKLVNDLDSYFT